MQNSVFTKNLKSSHGPYGTFGQNRFSGIWGICRDMAAHVGFHISRNEDTRPVWDQVQDLEDLKPGTSRKSRCTPFGTIPSAPNHQIEATSRKVYFLETNKNIEKEKQKRTKKHRLQWASCRTIPSVQNPQSWAHKAQDMLELPGSLAEVFIH